MGRQQKYGNEYDNVMANLYIVGSGLGKIAQEFDMHPQVVKRRLEKMGVPIRSRSEGMKQHHRIRREDV